MANCRSCKYYLFPEELDPDARAVLGEIKGYCTLYHVPLRELRRGCPGYRPLSRLGSGRVSRARLVFRSAGSEGGFEGVV